MTFVTPGFIRQADGVAAGDKSEYDQHRDGRKSVPRLFDSQRGEYLSSMYRPGGAGWLDEIPTSDGDRLGTTDTTGIEVCTKAEPEVPATRPAVRANDQCVPVAVALPDDG